MAVGSVRVQRFKSITDLEISLGGVTVLVGPNNAGKSSLLHALQFGTSACQSLFLNGAKNWSNDVRSGTLSYDQLIYTPLRDVHALAQGGRLRQEPTTAISIEFHDETGTSAVINVRAGKNKNLATSITGKALGRRLEDLDSPFSVVAPGLAGISAVEEYRARGIVRRAAARGDANGVFRNILWTLSLESDRWHSFHSLLGEIFPNVRVEVEFDEENGERIDVYSITEDGRLPIDSLGTGVLQAIQIVAYVGLYGPQMLILDEPDSHLHPDNQRKLAHLLSRLNSETGVQVLLATHSRHMLDEFHKLDATIHWLSNGALREEQYTFLSGLLDLGALDVGDRLRGGDVRTVVLTEDEDWAGLEAILQASGFIEGEYDIWSYKGCSRVDYAKLLTEFIGHAAPGTHVVVHRDRDYLTDSEVKAFEEAFEHVDATPFVTRGTDIESHFIDVDHLRIAYGVDDANDITEIIEEATAALAEESLEKMITARVEASQRARFESDGKRVAAGVVAAACTREFQQNPERYRRGKRVLRRIRGLAQDRFGKNVDARNVVSPSLKIDKLAKVAADTAPDGFSGAVDE